MLEKVKHLAEEMKDNPVYDFIDVLEASYQRVEHGTVDVTRWHLVNRSVYSNGHDEYVEVVWMEPATEYQDWDYVSDGVTIKPVKPVNVTVTKYVAV